MDANPPPESTSRLAPNTARQAGPRWRIGLGASIVLVVLALAVSVAISAFTLNGSSQLVGEPLAVVDGITDDHGTDAAGDDRVTTMTELATIFVHVLGAVRSPGLFEVSDGDRVVDVIAAAGGFSENADPGGVNLARHVSDGEQLYVPKLGEPAALQPGSQQRSGSGGTAGVAGKVNLNTASSTELETLPRVGPAMAERILDWRESNGRFTSVEDLMSITGIGEKTFESLKELVTV